MSRYLLDTGIAGDYLSRRRGVHERVLEAMANGHRVGIGLPVLGELWAGIDLSATKKPNEARLRRGLGQLVLWPFDHVAAREYGRIFAELRRMGRMIQQIDIPIAAIAITLGDCTVVTRDSDFAAITGLATTDWSRP